MSEKEIISNYMRELQRKGVKKRLENDPDTYKKMRAMREEKRENLTLVLES